MTTIFHLANGNPTIAKNEAMARSIHVPDGEECLLPPEFALAFGTRSRRTRFTHPHHP